MFVVLGASSGEEFFTRPSGLSMLLVLLGAVALAVGGYLNLKAVTVAGAAAAGPGLAGHETDLETDLEAEQAHADVFRRSR